MNGKGKMTAVAVCALSAASLAMGSAEGARVVAGKIIITADGAFSPSKLPKKAYAPIRIEGHARISTTDGTVPPALQTAVFEFDRNGHLDTRGLQTCGAGTIKNTTVSEARARCKGAIVGSGTAKAIVTLPGLPPVQATSPLTFFNGPRQGGNATVVIHAYATVPAPTTYVSVATIAKVHHGRFGYEVSTDIPSIAGGNGALTMVSLAVHRVFKYKGKERGYTSARCADGLLQAHGAFTFADGTIIAGSVFKPCWVRQ
jgi:hypothetical protein